MKTKKLKLLAIAVCSLAAALWSEAQCMDLPQIKKDEPIRNNLTESVPTGSIISFAGEIAPNGWLLCDGKDYSNQEYPELYEVIQTKYVQSGSWIIEANNRSKIEKHFCVPDLRGRVIVGVDGVAERVTKNNTLGASGGEEKHQLSQNELGAHRNGDWSCGVTDFCAGGNDPHNNMQPYLILNYIINTGKREKDNMLLRQKIRKNIEEIRSRMNSNTSHTHNWEVNNSSYFLSIIVGMIISNLELSTKDIV